MSRGPALPYTGPEARRNSQLPSWSSSLWLGGSRTPRYLWRGVPAALKRGATTGPTVRMRTPRSVFSAHWLNTLFHGDVLIARIHHLLLSRSFYRPPPLVHLFHFVNLPAASNPVCFSHLLVMSQNSMFQNFILIRLYRSQNRVLSSKVSLWYYKTIKKILEKWCYNSALYNKNKSYLSEEASRSLANICHITSVQLLSRSAGWFDDSKEASVNHKERHNVRLMPLAKLFVGELFV